MTTEALSPPRRDRWGISDFLMGILIHKTFFLIQFIHKLLPYLYNAILCYLTSINLQVDDLHKLILFVLFSVGRFESDALLVPRHCEFKHEHDTICASYTYWAGVAQRKCKELKMRRNDFAMLLDCDVDKFNGVEYVCCPDEKGKWLNHLISNTIFDRV